MALTSSTTSSATNTNQPNLDLAITADGDAVKWCVIESLDTDPDPAAPMNNDACFVSSRPTGHILSGREVRRISIWLQDSVGNVSLSPGVDTIDFPLPSVIEVTGPTEIDQYGCSEAIKLNYKDAYGLASYPESNETISLSGESSGAFYSDAGCITAVSTVTMNAGETSLKYYFKSSTLEPLTLMASCSSANDSLSTASHPCL